MFCDLIREPTQCQNQYMIRYAQFINSNWFCDLSSTKWKFHFEGFRGILKKFLLNIICLEFKTELKKSIKLFGRHFYSSKDSKNQIIWGLKNANISCQKIFWQEIWRTLFWDCERPRRNQRSEEKISKNVDFSLWGRQCGFPKLNFFKL